MKSVRELAKQEFDKYMQSYANNAFTWSLWKRAFDCAYNVFQEEELLTKVPEIHQDHLLQIHNKLD